MEILLYHLHKACLIHLMPEEDCEIFTQTKRMSSALGVKIKYNSFNRNFIRFIFQWGHV